MDSLELKLLENNLKSLSPDNLTNEQKKTIQFIWDQGWKVSEIWLNSCMTTGSNSPEVDLKSLSEFITSHKIYNSFSSEDEIRRQIMVESSLIGLRSVIRSARLMQAVIDMTIFRRLSPKMDIEL